MQQRLQVSGERVKTKLIFKKLTTNNINNISCCGAIFYKRTLPTHIKCWWWLADTVAQLKTPQHWCRAKVLVRFSCCVIHNTKWSRT